MERSQEGPVIALRPLGIGELLDRAVTTTVRAFVPLALIWAAFLLPLVICQYFGTQVLAKVYGPLLEVLTKPQSGGDPMKQLAALPPVFNGFTVAFILLALLAAPLATAAAAFAMSQFYLGRPLPSVGDAYRAAARRWLSMILLVMIWLAVAIVAIVVFAIAGVFAALLGAALVTMAKGIGLFIVIVFAVVALIAIFIVSSAVSVVYWAGAYAIVVESSTAVQAFGSSMRRVIRRSFRRSLLVGLALVAVDIGFQLITGLGDGLLYGLLRNNALGTAFSAVSSVVLFTFSVAFMGAYYYDLRVRTEGLDLELEAARTREMLATPVS